MRLTAPVGLCLVSLALGAAWMLVPWMEITQWAAFQQREFQNAMARSLRAIQSGEPAAIWSLCLATAAYGFVHALGPGHGKILLGGAALASGATLRRMASLTVASSLAQSASAILLVAMLLQALRLTSADAVALTEKWLAPISYAAVGAIGLILVLRGMKAVGSLSPRRAHRNPHRDCGCGHAHGPSLSEVRSLTSARDATALIASIAIRPCTGALFLLVIAARFEVFAVGVLAVIAMGFGTASFNLLVAGSGIATRSLATFGQTASGDATVRLSAGFHLIGGSIIITFSLILLRPYIW
jgi:ABC-type nickel/cobalt efflux system permease component RcnA